MKLVEETNLILRQKCDPFDFNEPIMDPYELVDELHKIRDKGLDRNSSCNLLVLRYLVLFLSLLFLTRRVLNRSPNSLFLA